RHHPVSRDITTFTSTYSTTSPFFSSHPPHQALHSFPTRRSSDLSATTSADRSRPRAGPPDARAASFSEAFKSSPAARSAGTSPKIGRAHVELQSPYDLVCRLLLEKKKVEDNLVSTGSRLSHTSDT